MATTTNYKVAPNKKTGKAGYFKKGAPQVVHYSKKGVRVVQTFTTGTNANASYSALKKCGANPSVQRLGTAYKPKKGSSFTKRVY